MIVAGTGSSLDTSGTLLILGGAGRGSLTVANGGVVSAGSSDAATSLILGSASVGSGALALAGSGSLVDVLGVTLLGGALSGSSYVSGGTGTITVGTGGTFRSSGGFIINTGSSLTSSGVVSAPTVTIDGGSFTTTSLTGAIDFGAPLAAAPNDAAAANAANGGQLVAQTLSGQPTDRSHLRRLDRHHRPDHRHRPRQYLQQQHWHAHRANAVGGQRLCPKRWHRRH